MQWTPGPQAGFSTNPHTWLPVAANYKTVNVETESGHRDSLLEWNEALIALRRSNAALHDGEMAMLDAGEPDVLAYTRTNADGGEVVVLMNMSDAAKTAFVHPAEDGLQGSAVETLAASDPALRRVHSLRRITLPAYASWVGEVSRKGRSGARRPEKSEGVEH